MKTILAYGDSLTWGYDAATLGRHPFQVRWPSVLEAGLGGAARVIAEGLNGRTTAFDDWLADADRNGARMLPTLLETHKPLDLVIIMLGANDMKPAICGSAIAAKSGMARLVSLVRNHDYGFSYAVPRVLLVAPPPCVGTDNADFAATFENAPGESAKLAAHYAGLADELGCAAFDAGTVAQATPLDGVHLDAENTAAIGRALVPVVRGLIAI
ncbi:MAG: SGNH/GDSL hydrolase family protein [Rhizobiaceae bacterium]